MPYKDPEKQRQAQHASYLRNKTAIAERQRERRQRPGYRDAEYAKRTPGARNRDAEYAARRGLTVEEYRQRKVEGTLGRQRKVEMLAAQRPRHIGAEERALIEKQRAMREATLRRLGLWQETEANPTPPESNT